MPRLNQADVEAALEFAGLMFECPELDAFAPRVLEGLVKMVPAESGTFNYLAPAVPKVVTVAAPELPDQAERTKRFAAYLPEHSVLSHFLTTGDPRAYMLSDFHTQRQYHELALYREFYREIEYEDQISFFLFPPGSELIGVSLARNRRGFSERERLILNLLRPQIARAYRHVERCQLAQRALTGLPAVSGGARVTIIVLGKENRALHFGPDAQSWICEFFPDKSRNPSCLPQEIEGWLRRISKRRGTLLGLPWMLRRRGNQRLRVSLFSSNLHGKTLLLSLEITQEAAQTARGIGLTEREIQVLLQVEQGKTNGEVSAALGITPLTVRSHLEHIFEKLKVQSRTAAVTRFRRICERRERR